MDEPDEKVHISKSCGPDMKRTGSGLTGFTVNKVLNKTSIKINVKREGELLFKIKQEGTMQHRDRESFKSSFETRQTLPT